MTTPYSGAPERSVVDRTLSILGTFNRDNRTLTLSDISRRSGLPVATVHRIVNKLHGWGALERCPDGGYSIGLRLWETAVLAPQAKLIEAAQPHLVELQRHTSAAATLAIRDGSDSICLSLLSNDRDLMTRCGDAGARLPLHATAVGLVLLAHASKVVQKEVCAGPLRAYTPATITDGAALRRCLTNVRREGYVVVRSSLVEGRGGIAAPVRDCRGAVIAAVAAVAPLDNLQPTRLLPQVLATAEAVSRCVGADGARIGEVGA
ncbi:IclR family transcriptional regulator [Streptomyces sp. NPDC001795]|uniref:IclR family transcriptional regulator n=1 Tax=Streptomyces sp. NPDC001795 TaxID=3154525 RepID=UPI003316515C